MKLLATLQEQSQIEQISNFMQTTHHQEEVKIILLTISKEGDWETDQNADHLFHEARSKLEALDLTHKKRKGKFADQVLQELKNNAYDLLILHWRKSPSPLPFPTADPITQIVDHAPCSTLILKDLPKPVRRILFCDSGSEKTKGLLDFLVKLIDAQSIKQEVTVLHVMSQMAAGPGIPGKDLRSEAEQLINKKKPEGKLLEKDIKTLLKAGFITQPKVRHGLVVDEILAEVREGEYDLVVIGSHQPGKGRALLLDNIAKKITRDINCSLLVVHSIR